MTRGDAEKVALTATLLSVLVLLYDHLSYYFGLWPR
jgi:hypothetical protein